MALQPRHYRRVVLTCVAGFLIFLAAFCSINCAASRHGQIANAGVVGAGVADLVSTRQAMARGAVERNPILGQSLTQQALVKALGVSGVIAGAHLLEQREQRVWAQIVRYTAIGVWSGAAVWNWRQR